MSGNNEAADRKSTWMLIKENILHEISDGFICILSYKGKMRQKQRDFRIKFPVRQRQTLDFL